MPKKVYLVVGRQNFEGPWKGISVHVAKKDANEAVRRQKIMWDELKPIMMYDYETAQYFRKEENGDH